MLALTVIGGLVLIVVLGAGVAKLLEKKPEMDDE